MSLAPGTTVASYEVLSPLGQGGMGEVYRARDAKLGRDVALKILPDVLALDADRQARFEREARTLAALNHPNIAHVYGAGKDAAGAYLVMELVEGEDLSAHIARGAIPISDALPIALQIVDALEAAHEAGVVHRDLKPGNIKVRADGTVKVLDFGLAKALESDPSSATAGSAANSPTLTARATQMGMILGTAAYMAPEQARGRAVDRRADIWAFGAVLYEMLTGCRAFHGDDVSITLASVLKEEVDWSALPADLPPSWRRLLRRCLQKDPRRRLSAIADARLELEEQELAAASMAAPPASGGRTVSLPVAIGLVVAAVVVTAAIAMLWRESDAGAPTGISRFTLVLPDGDQLNTSSNSYAPLAVAPDGSAVAYSAFRDGTERLFVWDFSEPEPRLLTGTDGATSPFFKPDGRWIGFFAQGKLRKITVAGTGMQDLADAPFPRGGAWSADDTLYFAPGNISGLRRVSASGGPDEEVTTLDRGQGEVSHRWPSVTPDGRTLLFSVWSGPGRAEHWIDRFTLPDGPRQTIVRNVDGPAVVVGGFLVNGGRLDSPQALPWSDAADFSSVEPIELPFASAVPGEGASGYAVSSTGTFAYLEGLRRTASVVWVDRSGVKTPLPLPERAWVAAVISPDGRHAALQASGATMEIWLYDFGSQTLRPFVTTGGSSQAPLWSHDSRYVYFRGTRSGFRNVFRKAIDGASAEERVTTKADVVHTPMSITSDGQWLLYRETSVDSGGGSDVWKLPLQGDPTPSPLIATPADERAPQVSPDGRWVAYNSDVSSRDEIWVQPFDGSGTPRQLSRDGGMVPLWSRDGTELYFTAPEAIMVVPVSGDAFGTPRVFAEGPVVPPQNSNTNFDIGPDGRLLVPVPDETATAISRIEIILNGLELMRNPGGGQ